MLNSEEDRHLKLAGEADCAPEPLPTLRHSTAHLMAQAVKQIFPEVKVAIGPAIEDGFYYDFAKPAPFTPEDLEKIEARMRELAKQDKPFSREEMPREKAIRFFEERGEPFKVEILRGIDAPTVSFYRQGDFVDLCRGPHVASTGAIRFFKLLSSSGAYWRGSEKNPMLQRIYGTAWLTKEELEKHLWRLEEAKKRDHRKLGRELDLFEFHDISPGAFWLPGGMVLVRELEKFARESLDARGYQEISTPMLVNKKLWEQSGHWELYQENMFKVEVEEETYSLKPMNCPESTFVYSRMVRSYRDLPIRYSEMGRCHRNERSGTLTGLIRVRQFTQDDAHIYCRPDQVQAEITDLLDLVREWYGTFGLRPSYRLSTRPPDKLGTDQQWDQAEESLHEALRANSLAYDLDKGGGAFYGPKIDVDVEDTLGRQWQVATIQVDLTMLPERMKCEYIDSDGQPKRPVVIHRAIFGSYERFIAILTEHFAGAFPAWLAPVQARILPVSEKFAEYGKAVHARLRAAGIRAQLDDRNEKLGYRIREAQVQKVPYMLVVGEREAQQETASVRLHGSEKSVVLPVADFLAGLAAEIGSRSATLTVGRSG